MNSAAYCIPFFKGSLVCSLILGSVITPCAAEETLDWRRAAAAPVERVEAPTILLNDKLYIFGGFEGRLRPIPHLDVYDPKNNTWDRLRDHPLTVTHLNPASDGKTVWFVGGYQGRHPGKVTAQVWQYDIAKDTWSRGVDLPEPRAGGALIYHEKRLHFFGGFADRNTTCTEHWTLSVSDDAKWEPVPAMPAPRGHMSAAVVGDTIYALGGQLSHDRNPQDAKECFKYQIGAKKWKACADLPFNRSHFEPGTFVLDERIVIVGGRSNNTKHGNPGVAHITQYDPKTDKWTELDPLPQRLLAPSAAVVDGHLVVIAGGLNNTQPVQTTTWIRKWSAK
jgi:N-acetylneuraminic acid mutarotase